MEGAGLGVCIFCLEIMGRAVLGFLGAGGRLPKARRGRVCCVIHHHPHTRFPHGFPASNFGTSRWRRKTLAMAPRTRSLVMCTGTLRRRRRGGRLFSVSVTRMASSRRRSYEEWQAERHRSAAQRSPPSSKLVHEHLGTDAMVAMWGGMERGAVTCGCGRSLG